MTGTIRETARPRLTPWQQRMSFADELTGPLFDLDEVNLDHAFANDGPLAGLPNLWQADDVPTGSEFSRCVRLWSRVPCRPHARNGLATRRVETGKTMRRVMPIR